MDAASTTPIADAVPELLPLGSPFPAGELLDRFGNPTTIAETAVGPAVVVFYRGAWCPYCNIALRSYRTELAPALLKRGVTLIAVSPQSADGSMTMAEKLELEFPVLSDPGNQLGAGLGILTRPSDEVLTIQVANGLDITEGNADGTPVLPMPTTAIIDASGVLRWIDVHPDHTTRTEPAAVIAALDELGL